MKIDNATVLVTGASGGIGAATARAMAARGARVMLMARNDQTLASVVAAIRASGGQAWHCAVDLGDAAAAQQAFDQLTAAHGNPDIVVNCAGAGRWLFTEETSPEEMVQMMAAPYYAAFHVTRLCLPHMLRQNRGHIVNVNSPAAFGGWPGAAAYTAARCALYGFTTALRHDLRKTGVKVSSIVPGKVSDSEYFKKNEGVVERIPKIAVVIPEVTSAQVAAKIVSAVEREKREVVMPLMLNVILAMHWIAPRVVEWVIAETGWSHS